MTSREIIIRNIEHRDAPRIGYDFKSFLNQQPTDIAGIGSAKLINPKNPVTDWNEDPEIAKLVPNFRGETRRDHWGNIIGRFEGKTKGECILGAIEEWEDLDNFILPEPDAAYQQEMKVFCASNPDKYRLAYLPVAIFSVPRDLRKMDNVLMDILADKENLTELLTRVLSVGKRCIQDAAEAGFDGMIFHDDWGVQDRLFIHPKHWVEVFKPIYAEFFAEAHRHNLHVFMHSCGYVYDIIPHLIEIGVNVFQFDQPALVGAEKLGREFGDKISLFSPVDIQKVLATGDRAFIEAEARRMINAFKPFKGGLIAKDYGNYPDINVDDSWAQWARNVFICEGQFQD